MLLVSLILLGQCAVLHLISVHRPVPENTTGMAQSAGLAYREHRTSAAVECEAASSQSVSPQQSAQAVRPAMDVAEQQGCSCQATHQTPSTPSIDQQRQACSAQPSMSLSNFRISRWHLDLTARAVLIPSVFPDVLSWHSMVGRHIFWPLSVLLPMINHTALRTQIMG